MPAPDQQSTTSMQTTSEPAFRRLLDDLTSLADLEASWLEVSSQLLKFCWENAPNDAAWGGLPPHEPESTVLTVAGLARSELLAIDPEKRKDRRDDERSFASKDEREALRRVALEYLAVVSELSEPMKVAATALGLAEAADGIAGKTFLPWFRARGELTVSEGNVYPIRELDPRPWLGTHRANSRTSHLPSRDLSSTANLRVASAAVRSYKYVLDFQLWNLLSELGGSYEFIGAVGQPNEDLDEFRIDLVTEPRKTYGNHGPKEDDQQKERFKHIISKAGNQKVSILVMPEYGLSSGSRELLIKELPAIDELPHIIVSGVSAGKDEDGFIINESIMVVRTADDSKAHVITLPYKLHPAEVEGFTERIKRSSEIKLFLTERWTIAVIICFDVMDKAVVDQLAAFGTNLLLVPALSSKTATMVGEAISLCHSSQAFVVIATGPAKWTSRELSIVGDPEVRSEAVFAGPYAVEPTAVHQSSDGSGEPRPNLWMFNYRERTISEYVVYNS